MNILSVLDRVYRQLATGFCFTLFGVGGLILPWLALPIIFLIPGSVLQRERRAKAVIRVAFRGFVEVMRCLGLLTYSVPQRELLNAPGQLILANHPTLIDVVLLIAFTPRADCIVKGGLLRNPFMRLPIKVAGFIANDDPEQMVSLAAASLARGNNLVIFPESTRTTPGQPLRMKRGAANIALRAEQNIRPVVINCEPITLSKQHSWYQIPQRRFHLTLSVQPKITITSFLDSGNIPLATRKLTRFLEQYFTQELTTHDRIGAAAQAAHH